MNRCLVVCLIVLSAAPAFGAALSLPITVTEPAGLSRVAEPVSGGIPLPQGRYKKGQAFALFDARVELPVQTTPLVVDENGYLRWILLDFQTDLKAREKKTFTLEAAPAAQGDRPTLRRDRRYRQNQVRHRQDEAVRPV